MDLTPPNPPLNSGPVEAFVPMSQPPPTSPLRDRIEQMQRMRVVLRAEREGGQATSISSTTAVTSTMSRFRNADEFLAGGISKVEDLTSTSTFSFAKSGNDASGESSSSGAEKSRMITSSITSTIASVSIPGASVPKASKKCYSSSMSRPAILASSVSLGKALGKASKKRKSLTDETCECPICYNPMGGKTTRTREEAVRIIACGHVFGRTCLETHVNSSHASSNTCPMCRAELWRAPRSVYGGRYRHVRLDHLQNFGSNFQAVNDRLAAFEGNFATLEGDMTALRDRLAIFREVYGGDADMDGATTRTPVEVETQQGRNPESMRDRLRRRLLEHRDAAVASRATGGSASVRFFAAAEDEGNTEIQEMRTRLATALRGRGEATSAAQGGGAPTPAEGLQSLQSDADDEAEVTQDDADGPVRIRHIEDLDLFGDDDER